MGIYRQLPQLYGPGTQDSAPGRHSPYGEAYAIGVGAGNWAFADEGSYFTVANATLATGIAGHAAPVVADTDTKALFALFNTGDKNIVFDFLFLEVTAAGTAGTLHYTTIYLDNKGTAARSSGGTALTPVNTNTGVATASIAEVYFGAVVTAMSSSRKVGQQIVREVIPVVQDTVLMKFGESASVFSSALASGGAATNHCVQSYPPLVIAPGGNLNISQIRPSQSAAASYQVHAGWWER